MKISVDFSALRIAVDKMGACDVTFDPVDVIYNRTEGLAEDLFTGIVLGEDVPLDEITSEGGVLEYLGHQVMLYIQDQGAVIRDVINDGEQGKRIHVAECSTLDKMRNTGRFPRYGVISRIDGLFPVQGTDLRTGQLVEGEAALCVCKNCLSILNYKGYTDKNWQERKMIFDNFNFEEFFEAYSSHFRSLPLGNSKRAKANYSSDWAAISARVRKSLDYMCEHCGVCLRDYPSLLHVHHINGVKSDNKRNNLRALCVDCHKKQPHHGHMHIKHDDILTINRLRREQHKFNVFDYRILKRCADSALEGLLSKCEKHGLPVGELGLCLKVNQDIVGIDIAWTRRKVAVLLDKNSISSLQNEGWTVFTPHQALTNFPLFQRTVR